MTTADTTGTRDDVRAAIVDAAARVLREQGVRAVTTRGVAQAAGVQAPTIYRLFGDKDGLLDAVAEHVMATYVAAKADTASADDPTDPVAALRAGWRTHVAFGLANPELFALLHSPARADSPAAAAGLRVLRARVRRIAAAGLLRGDEERAVRMVHAAGTGAVLALLAAPPAHRDHGLAEAMFDAVAAQVLAAAPAASGADVVPLVVAFSTAVPDLPALTAAERALMGEWLARVLVDLRP
jgi:AcrR family transcriptional regulator